jgi:putative DNA primase/helicase
MSDFTASKSDRHPTDLAMMRGARIVSSSETEEGRAWAETRIKQLTGGDTISARFMHQDFFKFRPQFKLVIIGNHKPTLRNVGVATQRRFNIVPFEHQPPVQDLDLETKLRKEAPGILRWLIDGCLDWRKNGLVRPPVVVKATSEYFAEQDTVNLWIADKCEMGGRNLSDTHAKLFESWKYYRERRGTRFRQVAHRTA